MKTIEMHDALADSEKYAPGTNVRGNQMRERKKIEKYFDMIKAQTPGLSYYIYGTKGPEYGGPMYKVQHADEDTLDRALLKMEFLSGSEETDLERVLAQANEEVDSLDDRDLHLELIYDKHAFH